MSRTTDGIWPIVGPIRFGGKDLYVQLEVYPDELARRTTFPDTRPCSVETLDALFEIPAGATVDLADPTLRPAVRYGLDQAPTWAVDRDGTTVTRTYQPAATVQWVLPVDPAAPWPNQLDSMQWFAPLARTLCLVPTFAQSFAAIDAARPLGIAVAVIDPSGAWHLVSEPDVARIQLHPARWNLAETATDALNHQA